MAIVLAVWVVSSIAMTGRTFDAIIIGAGQAGPSLAGRLTAAGQTRRHRRAQAVRRHLRQHRLHADQDLVASAYAAHLARRAADYGVSVGGEVTST